MLLTAELLLNYQRCNRRAFLDVNGDPTQQDPLSDFQLKLQQDRLVHQQTVLAGQIYHQLDYARRDWKAAFQATLTLMQQGVERIHRGVLVATTQEGVTLLSHPDLLVKQPGRSNFGDWHYIPIDIHLGRRPKLEYQIMAGFHVKVLASVQGALPGAALLILREKGSYQVNLAKVMPQMQSIAEECIQMLRSPVAPEVFISRQKCNLCRWYSSCHAIAQSQQHLSLLPGVTPSRYAHLQALNLDTVKSLATANPTQLEPYLGDAAAQLVLQAQAVVQQRAILSSTQPLTADALPTSPIELYFDIEAQPDLALDFLLGVVVVDRLVKTETFYPFLAETPEAEGRIWEQFFALVSAYPLAPIFHFCDYEVETVKRLARRYNTPPEQIVPLLKRFVDIHARVTQSVTLPTESYALKHIARWLNFEWRDPKANGQLCIYWYDQWLATGDRRFLDAICRYNEDDCLATFHVKEWLTNLLQSSVNFA